MGMGLNRESARFNRLVRAHQREKFSGSASLEDLNVARDAAKMTVSAKRISPLIKPILSHRSRSAKTLRRQREKIFRAQKRLGVLESRLLAAIKTKNDRKLRVVRPKHDSARKKLLDLQAQQKEYTRNFREWVEKRLTEEMLARKPAERERDLHIAARRIQLVEGRRGRRRGAGDESSSDS